jgi:hypothetical protein
MTFRRIMLPPSSGLICVGWEIGWFISVVCEKNNSFLREGRRRWNSVRADQKTTLFRATVLFFIAGGKWNCNEGCHLPGRIPVHRFFCPRRAPSLLPLWNPADSLAYIFQPYKDASCFFETSASPDKFKSCHNLDHHSLKNHRHNLKT